MAVLVPLWVSLASHLAAISASHERNVEMARNFFGVLRVQELDVTDPSEHQLSLVHGRIEHGSQYLDPVKRKWPVTYYGHDSGLGLALSLHPNRIDGKPMRIGVIGLGTGTVAAHGRPET